MAADLFIAFDHLLDLLLNLIVRWEVSRTPNLDCPIGHVHLSSFFLCQKTALFYCFVL